MTTAQAVGAVSSEAALWYAIDWQAIHRNVRRLQVCIAQATYQSRVSLKEAFEGLEPDEAKVSRPVLRGRGDRKVVPLLGPNLSRLSNGTG
jgi:hypothetical protein